MKKITLLILLFVCAIGFGQRMVSTMGDNNPVVYGPQKAQQQSPVVNSNPENEDWNTIEGRMAVMNAPKKVAQQQLPVSLIYGLGATPKAASAFGERNAVFNTPKKVLSSSNYIAPRTTNSAIMNQLGSDYGSNSFTRSSSVSSRTSTLNPPAGTATRLAKDNQGQDERMPVVITHSVTQNITPANSVTCNAGGIPTENSFYRDFDLAGDFGIAGDFDVTDVEFAIEVVSGPVNLTLNVYSLAGTFPADYGSAVLQGTAAYTADVGEDGTIVSVPLVATIPAGERMIYEYRIDAGATFSLFPGSNADGQTDVSYIAAADCGLPAPTDLAAIGFPNQHMVMNVIGDEAGGGGGGAPCSQVNPTNGFENGFTTSSNTPQIIANDITVDPDTDFTVETMTVNILATVGETITSADITFYNDLAGVPDAGSVINSQLAVVPTSQSVIGNAFGFDVNEVIFDITPELLAGQAGLSTTYWTSIYVTTSANGNGFIDSSTVGIPGFEQAFSPDAGVTWLTNGGWDSVYDIAGQCEPIGGGGGCTPGTLATTLAGGNGNFGNMFDINSLTDLTIDSFDIHGDTGATFDVEVWAKTGTWVGSENTPGDWTLIGTAPGVVSNGDGVVTPLNLTLGYAMAAGETHAFYVTPTDTSTGGFNYTNGTAVGTVFASDANIEFLEGNGNAYPFGTTFQPRVFNGNIIYCVGGGGGGPGCAEENPNDFTFENGLNCSSASAFQTANDVTVADGEDFEINQITASIFANGGIALVDVIYYDDAGGLPGAVIGSESGIVPTSQVVIGSNFGFDVNEIVLDLTPFTFAGQNGSTTTYWTELSVTDGGGTGSVFWVVTSSSAVGNPTALFNGSWAIFDPVFDGVYIWSGECTPLAPDPTYDTCDGALPISCGEIAAGSTIGATVDSAVAPTCDTSVTAPGVWYVYQDTTGLVTDITITTCNGTTDYDAKLSVYTGDCGSPPLTCVVGNDDTCGLQPEVSFQSDGATTFYILVHGFASNVGNFEIEMICTPVPPPNDMIANSIDVDEIGFPYTDPSVAMPAATTEAGTPADCDNAGVKGVWYNFVPTGDGDATASITTPGGGLMFTVNNGPLAGNYPAVAAAFGGAFTSTPITEDTAVVIDDNSGGGTDPNDACEPIINGPDLNGKIAIIRRGACAFTGKVLAAQNEGAIAVIMVNNVAGDPIIMGGTEPLVTIPALMLSDVNGEAIIAEVSGGGTVNVTMVEEPAAFSSVTFYTAPNENAVETDLTLVPWFENQCVPGIQATIPTVAGQAYYVYVSNPGAITDIVIDGTNLGVESNTIEGFTYYPNPTSSTLNLSSVENIENVEIYNMLGQKVIDLNVNATTSEIGVSDLSTGTYIMKVSVNGQIGTYKILKQ